MNSHLYSCLISNRPSGGFFASEKKALSPVEVMAEIKAGRSFKRKESKFDIDGLSVGSFADIAQSAKSNERSEAQEAAKLHRLVKASKSPTGEDVGQKEAYGVAYSPAELKRISERQRALALGNVGEWERLMTVDYPRSGAGSVVWDVIRDNDIRFSDYQKPAVASAEGYELIVDPSRIGSDAEQTHSLDLTTGEIKRVRRSENAVGTKVVVEKREWADEYRIRTKTDMATGAPPPENTGPRYTKMLSLDGARSISESCRYMALRKGGFSTFLTLTLDSFARRRVEICENVGPCTEVEYSKKTGFKPVVTRLGGAGFEYKNGDVVPVVNGYGYDQTYQTVQKELSRFWDAANKVYQRGWVQDFEGRQYRGKPSQVVGWSGEMVASDGGVPDGRPVREKLQYSWVVENPKNEDGSDNPHVHILMKWRVPFRQFGAWAARIESIWGQGFAHLEKIKDPECAGAYMAKAAGYMTKATGESDQGLVRGNRYGISSEARAPSWDIVGIYENGLMGSLIRDVYDHFLNEHGSKIQRRDWLKNKLSETEKDLVKERQKIGKALEKLRKELNKNPNIPHRPSKYQLVVTGVHRVQEFFNWARDRIGYYGGSGSWLPVKDAGAYWEESRRPDGPYLAELKRRRGLLLRDRVDRWKGACVHYWKSLFDAPVPCGVGGDVNAWDYCLG